jgi:biopolymer transport protein ExbB
MQPRRIEDTKKELIVRVMPLIGLFGTVLGIVRSFQRIDAMGSASLAVVGSGIVKAFLGTAAGLASAIATAYVYGSLPRR